MSTKRLLVDWKGLKQLGWPYSRAHTWRLMEAESFPRCFKLGKHRNSHPVWWLADILGHFRHLGLPVPADWELSR
jgi:predicted DNA-binding transcriptional regulator AlpA